VDRHRRSAVDRAPETNVIATTRGIAVLAAIAIALVALSFVGGERSHGPIDRLLVADFDASKVTQINISWGERSTQIKRTGDEWRIDDNAVADDAAIDAIFTALRGGRWHRRAARKSIRPQEQPHGSPNISINDLRIAIGPRAEGLAQTWIFRDDNAFLVDNWVADALVPDLMALRAKHPLDCTSETSIVATTPTGTVRIQGAQLIEPSRMWLDEAWLRALGEACARVEIRGLDGHAEAGTGIHVAAGKSELEQVGSCADKRLVYIESKIGKGCVSGDDLRALADVLGEPRPDVRPLPIEPAKLTLQDGTVLDVTGKRVGNVDADPERVRELISALMTRGTVKPRPATKPSAAITAIDRDGTEVVLEQLDRAIARRGESVAIEIAPDAWKIITRPTAALRDPVRWREDATTISAITLDNITYKRGAALGEWTREPAGKLDPTLVDAVVESVATLRAPTAPTARPHATIAHRLRITIAPPAGAPITHAIELAAPTHDGCAGRVDNAAVLLPLPLCTAAIALASSR
jgi:hypothetical protein